MLLILFIVIIFLLLLLIPYVVRYGLYQGGFNLVHFTYIHPFKLSSIQLRMPCNLSYVRMIHIYCASISLTIRNRRIVLECYRPQVIFQVDSRQFEEVDFLKARQDALLMHNLNNILEQTMAYWNKCKEKPKKVKNIRQQPSSKFYESVKGLCNFVIMLLLQAFQVDVKEMMMDITPPTDSTELLKLKSAADFSFYTQLITVRFNLNASQDLQMKIQNQSLQLIQASSSYKQLYKTILRLTDVQVTVVLPFTFSFAHSCSKSKITLSTDVIQLNIIPKNFDQIFDIIAAINFFNQLKKQCQVQQQQDDCPKLAPYSQLNIQFSTIRVAMSDLYQPGIDNQQSEVYLSGVVEMVATGRQFQITLSPQKGLQNFQISIKSIGLEIKLFQSSQSVFTLYNFLFVLSQPSRGSGFLQKVLSHDNVEVNAGPYTVACLTKIFYLILRTRREHYEFKNYHQPLVYFMNLNRLPTNHELIRLWPESKSEGQNVEEQPNELIYKVKEVAFKLKIRRLEHIAVFKGFSLRKIYSRRVGISVIDIQHFTMQTLITQLRQFDISKAQIYVKQCQFQDQVNLFISSVTLDQNEQTVIEYLSGFTLLKTLLQINHNTQRKSQFKASNQTFHFSKINLKYLSLFFKVDEVYVQTANLQMMNTQTSIKISKIQLLVRKQLKMPKARFYFVDPDNISKEMTLLEVRSINMTSKQDNFGRLKHSIFILNPKFKLPKELMHIGWAMQQAKQTLTNLNLYIEAYIKNISDDNLIAIKLHQQNRIQSPDSFNLNVQDIEVCLQDSEWNVVFLNYSRVVRQYLSTQTFYNEQQIINQLNRRKKTHGLLVLKLSNITFSLCPLQGFDTVDHIESHLDKLGQYPFLMDDVSQFQHFRALSTVGNMTIQVRDYAYPLLTMTSSVFKADCVITHMKPQYEQYCSYYFLWSDLELGGAQLTFGLCLSPAFSQLVKRIRQLLEDIQVTSEQKHQQELWLEEISRLKRKDQQAGKLKTKVYIPYWEIIKNRCFFDISFKKQSDIMIHVLTGLYPYDRDMLSVRLKQLTAHVNKNISEASILGFRIQKQFPNKPLFAAVDIGKATLSVNFTADPLINIKCQLKFDSSQQHIIHLRKDLMEYLIGLPQLRTDVLRLYGIHIKSKKSRIGSVSGQNVEVSLIRRFNYGEIAKLTLDNQLQVNRNSVSIWNVISSVSFSCSIKEILFVVSMPEQQQSQGIQLLVTGSALNIRMVPCFRQLNAQWIPLNGEGNVDLVVGSYYTGQPLTLSHIGQFIRKSKEFRFVSEKLISEQIETECIFTQRSIFILCQSLVYCRDKIYENHQKDRFIVKNFVSCRDMRVVLSSQIKKLVFKLLKMPSQLDIVVRKQMTFKEQSPTIAQTKPVPKTKNKNSHCLDKFRRAVRLLIRSKRHEQILDMIRKVKLDLIFVLQRPQFNVFYEQKNSQVVLTSNQGCHVSFKQQFLKYDTLSLDPKYVLNFNFPSFQIWTSDQCQQVRWVSPQSVDKLQVRQVLQSGQTAFSMVDYELKTCDLNFEMTLEEILADRLSENEIQQRKHMWSHQPRFRQFKLDFQQVNAQIDKIHKRVLLNIVQFFILLASSKKRFLEQAKIAQAKINQLKIYSKAKVLKKLLQKTYKDIEETPRLENQFRFVLKRAKVGLINREMPNSPCFMQLNTQKITLHMREYNSNYTQRKCQVEQIEIINPCQPANSDYRTVLSMNHLGRTAIFFNNQVYYQSVFEQDVSWPYHKLFSIKLNPIKFRLTDELYQQLYEYAFKNIKEEAIKTHKYQIIEEIEEYYNKIIIQPIKVQLWYRSSNLLKRMDGISVTLDQFTKGNKFALKKDIFDIWVRFVLKQLSKQIFSVIGQKIFGGDEGQDSSEGEANQ